MKSNLTLDQVLWKPIKVKELFSDIYRGKRHIEKHRESGKIQYYSASSFNNGVTDFISNPLFKDRDKLVVTTFCDCYYAQGDFTASDEMTILDHPHLNKESGLFLSQLIKANKSKFAFGRKAFSERVKEQIILVPVTEKGEPHWNFMENYVKQEQKEIAQKVINYYEQKMLETGFDLVGLEEVEWEVYPFDKIFRKIQRGRRLKKDDHIDGDVPYVSSRSLNNGVDGFIGNDDKVRKFKNNLTLANSGSVGSCFYHHYEYIASDHVTSLTLENADKYIYLFMATIVKRLEEKYSFNREVNDKRIRTEKLILPVDENGKPHWDYMSKFMQKIEAKKPLNIYIYELAVLRCLQLQSLEEKEWKEFWLEDIVSIESGIDIYARERIDGATPYVTATAQNNGIGYFVDNKNKTIEEKCISVNRNGSVGNAFYHDYPALFGNDTRKLIPKCRNKYISLFLTRVITNQKEKYGYGYKMGTARLKRQKILLPVNIEGKPDYSYMKEYMKIKEIEKQYKILEYYYGLLEA